MSDLNMMMRQQAISGLQTQLDTAVTNGDTEAARKVAADIAKLEVQTAPKAPPYGDVEIKNALETKADWFGTDPEKSAAVIELGKHMNPKKFATAELFAEALIKAVDAKFKPAAVVKDDDADEEEDGEAEDDGEEDKPAPKRKKTDAPGEGDALGNRGTRVKSGPWTKLTDAPATLQTEIKRAAEKFVSKSGDPKDVAARRETFIAKMLESQYGIHQRAKGKK